MSSHDFREINPDEAFEILQQNSKTLLLDVRSKMEYDYVGHPPNAINIPWIEFPHWQVDPEFTQKVQRVVKQLKMSPEDLTILTLCRSGGRSQAAAIALLQDGFHHVYNILEGFEGDRDHQRHRGTINGWRFRGLPWEQG